MSRRSAGVIAFAVSIAGSLVLRPTPAARAADSPPTARSSHASDEPKKFADLFEGLEFRNIGPFRGGRVAAVTGVRHEPLTFYFGATGGGVWKTTDGGSNWECVSDKDFKTGSVGAIAVSDSDTNVVYVGMGEAPIRGNVSHGDGVYKSTDGGISWKNLGLKNTRQISRVRVHPTEPDIVYVAAQGHVWGPNPERGVYRSTDGGKSWSKVLYIDDKTGASDLAMDPSNPRVLYAAFWQVVRRPWELVDGGPGSSLYKTTDGGDTWKKIESDDLPKGVWGKVGVAVSASKPSRVYTFIEAKDGGGLFVSDDRGKKWKHVNDEHKIRERGWYYSWVYPDPKNPDTVYLPNVRLHKSTDGGKSFANFSCPHGDNHDMWIDPDEPNRMIVGNDGGAAISFNGGQTWSTQNNQPTAQFYRVATDNRYPYWVYGSQQDNSNVAMPSGVPGAGIDMADWHAAGGGESGWMAPDPKDPEVVYAGEYGGQITRYDHRTRQAREIMAWPQLADGHDTKDLKYRFQWNAPIWISLHDPKALYHASQKLLVTRDQGETWQEASPDLTRNDVSKQGGSGGPIARDITGVELYSTIFAISESPVEAGVMWTGSDDGLVQVTRDGGKTWQNVTPKGMPEWIQVNAIDASPHEKGAAYVAATMYKFDDFAPYLYKTKDYGKTWTKIVSGIPPDAFTRVVREDTARRGLLYAGTETGLYVSFDDGGNWRAFQRNLPATPVTDLAVKNEDLVVATQGRGFWILDDLTPLRQWDEQVPNAAVRLFPPRAAVRMQTETVDEEDEPLKGVGTNIPNGVIVQYWLKDKPKEKEKVTIEVLADGKVIRSFSNEKPDKEGTLKEQTARDEEEKDRREKPLDPKAGMNRFVWDMRVFRPTLAPKAVFNEGTKTPPKVGPGTYEIRLTAAGHTEKVQAIVKPHPAGYVSVEDLQAQYALLAAIRDRLSETHTVVMKIRDVKAQLKAVGERSVRLGKGDAVAKRAAALSQKLSDVEEKLVNPNIQADEDDLNYEPKLDHDWTNLAGIVASADAKPTKGSLEYYDLLKGRLAAVVADYDRLMAGEVAEFNRSLDEQKIPRIAPAPKLVAGVAEP